MATITFLGAVEGVTGSAYLLTTKHSRILLDCGLFQGRREVEQENLKPFPFAAQDIDAVVLSHAHLDHSGRLPLLKKQGFSGSIYTTWASFDLLEVLLKDAASLQARDAEWENKRRRRAGREEIQALYDIMDVEETLALCFGVNYDQRISVSGDVDIRFLDAGHILGSAIVEVFVKEGKQEKKLVFSGDLGNSSAALLKDPAVVRQADIVLLESTYGDRDHRPMDETLAEFEEIITDASRNGGNILIPSFAVGRTQEIIFRLGELYQQGKLRHQAVYLDSPMAIAVTEIYHRYQHAYNEEDSAAMKQANRKRSLRGFLPVLRYATSTEESMALNRIDSGAIIIAGSGMCNGGRIRHHLKHNIWRQRSHVIVVGYQALGTPGRALVDGAKTFKMAGEEITVAAKIHTLGGFSAHAGQSQLIAWASRFEEPHPMVYLVHGEENAKFILRQKLGDNAWKARIPAPGESVSF